MKYRRKIVFCTTLLLGINTVLLAEQGDDSAFFQQRSQHAYNAVFGLPVVAPRLVKTLEWQISAEHSNQFAGGREINERLILDGETTRLSIRHRRRLSPCWQLEATLPFISHSGGLFDGAIDSWHKVFGFPDADRDSTDFDALTYQYSNHDGVKHAVTRPQSGIGDVQLALQRSVGCFATESTSADPMIRVGIKLPTGNPSELRGSGEADFFADWQSPVWSSPNRWNAGIALGALINGNTERFADQKPVVFYGSLGTQYVVHHKFRLIAQLDGHSSFYNSALRELGVPAVNLVVGARYLYGSAYTFELSISEDAAIDTTPDIVARLALTYRPDQTGRRLSAQ